MVIELSGVQFGRPEIIRVINFKIERVRSVSLI